MRLIDADVLPHYNGYSYSALEIAHAVEKAPTIEPPPNLCSSCKWKEWAATHFGEIKDE